MSSPSRSADVDPTAEFEAFFHASCRKTIAAVYLVVRSHAEAEDIAQEAYVRAASAWSKIRSYDEPAAWVRRVAYNLALNSVRGARRRVVVPLSDADGPSVADLPDDLVDLRRAMTELPVRYRIVLTMHYLWELTVPEIAEELGMPVHTVKTQLARGRRRLARLVDPPGPPEAVASQKVRIGDF